MQKTVLLFSLVALVSVGTIIGLQQLNNEQQTQLSNTAILAKAQPINLEKIKKDAKFLKTQNYEWSNCWNAGPSTTLSDCSLVQQSLSNCNLNITCAAILVNQTWGNYVNVIVNQTDQYYWLTGKALQTFEYRTNTEYLVWRLS